MAKVGYFSSLDLFHFNKHQSKKTVPNLNLQECIPVGCSYYRPEVDLFTMGSMPRGVSVQGGLCLGGVSVQGEVSVRESPQTETPLFTEWRTWVKTLPCPKLRLRVVKMFVFRSYCISIQIIANCVLVVFTVRVDYWTTESVTISSNALCCVTCGHYWSKNFSVELDDHDRLRKPLNIPIFIGSICFE